MTDRDDLPTVRLAHVSDTHLGREQYAKVTSTGANQRGADIVDGFRAATDQIVRWDPPLVIHSGDVGDVPNPPIRYIIAAKRLVSRAAARRPDGTLRQYVIVPGNHDEPSRNQEASWLELLRDLPGVHIAQTPYDQITFDPERDDCAPELAHVTVHAVPHSGLAHPVVDDVAPTPGRLNVFTTHGVAEGHELFAHAVGKEHPIPGPVIARSWEYAALGHYHVRGPVVPGSASTDPSAQSHAWYAGSTETIRLSDCKDPLTEERGWLAVTLRPGRMPSVEPKSYRVRRVIRLPDLHADDLDQSQIVDRLLTNLAQNDVEKAIAVQKVRGVTRDLWSTVDAKRVRAAARHAVRYELQPIFRAAERHGDNEEVSRYSIGIGDLPKLLRTHAASLVNEEALRREVIDEAVRAIDEVMTVGASARDTGAGTVDAPAPKDGEATAQDPSAAQQTAGHDHPAGDTAAATAGAAAHAPLD